MTVRRGMVALGDSITRGRGGAPALGVHPQSWAQWVAEALELSAGGLTCESFAQCRASMDAGLAVDYNGATGQHFGLDANGDVNRAWFEVYKFDDAGNDVGGRKELSPE